MRGKWRMAALWITISLSFGLSRLVFGQGGEYKQKTTPTGGTISSYPSSGWRSDIYACPVWKYYDQFLDGNDTVSPLTASWSPAWEDVDEEWYCDEYQEDVYDTGGFWWEDGSAGGTFANQSAASPGYIGPSQSSGGSQTVTLYLKLKDTPLYYDDPLVGASGAKSSTQVRIYDTHLTRDIANEGGLDSNATWATCMAAANHAYNGSAGTTPIASPYGGTAHTIFDINNPDMDEASEVSVSPWAARGRVVIYTRTNNLKHIETLTGSGGATWGANTPNDPGSGHWSVSSVGKFLLTYGPDGDNSLELIEIYTDP